MYHYFVQVSPWLQSEGVSYLASRQLHQYMHLPQGDNPLLGRLSNKNFDQACKNTFSGACFEAHYSLNQLKTFSKNKNKTPKVLLGFLPHQEADFLLQWNKKSLKK